MSSVVIGRAVLMLLVGIHWVLPFTPVNPHEEARILVASVILGAAFLALMLWSYRNPRRAFAGAAALLALVIAVSATTGASPLLEGAAVKVLLLAGLVSASKSAAVSKPDYSGAGR